MYFFDLQDYYYPTSSSGWFDSGISGTIVGCAGGPIQGDWEDVFTTARATSDVFFNAINEYKLSGLACSNNTTILDTCRVEIFNAWTQESNAMISFIETRAELHNMITLTEYFYNYNKSAGVSGGCMSASTHDDYVFCRVNNPIYSENSTGTTTGTAIVNVASGTTFGASAITSTINFGTSFLDSDLQTKFAEYDTAIKNYMCSVKNLMSVIDGDTFDEYYE